MPLSSCLSRRSIAVLIATSLAWTSAAFSAEVKRTFNIAAGKAEVALKAFSEQSTHGVIFSTDAVAGITTNAVRGEFTPPDALARLVAGTGLTVQFDRETGGFAVKRASGPNAQGADAPQSSRPALTPAMESTIAGSSSRPAGSGSDRDTIVLSPFEVTSEGDEGYRATSTLAGTRLRSELRDVAASVSVITRDFMRDVGANDLGTLLNYTVGTEVTGASGNLSGAEAQSSFVDYDAVMRDPSPRTRVRGLTSADTTRDYFISDVPLDGYITDRIDINRGANAMLFGLGSPGGVINNGLIKAKPTKNATEVGTEIGRFGTLRATFDHNQVLIRDKLAVRVATLLADRRYQQEFTYGRDKRMFGTLTFKPFRETTLRVNSEFARRNENRPWSRPPYDEFSFWWAYGKPTWNAATATGALLGVPLNSTLAGINANGTMNATLLQSGLGLFNNAGAPVIVYENPHSSKSGISGLPNSTNAFEAFNERVYANGTNGGSAQMRPSQVYNRWINGGTASPLSNFWRDSQLTDTSVFDFYNHTLDGGAKREWAKWRTHSVTLEQTFLRGLAGVELAWDKQDLDSGFRQPVNNREYAINLDINTTLPNGAPNPNFGRPFTESIGFVGSSGGKRDAFRFTSFVDFDPKKHFDNRLLRWLGHHVATYNYSDQTRRNYDAFSGRQSIMGTDYSTADNVGPVASGRRVLASLMYMGDSVQNLSGAHEARLSGPTDNQFYRPLTSVNLLYYPQPAVGQPQAAWQYRTFSVVQNKGDLITETTAFTPSRSRQEFSSQAFVVQSKWIENTLVSTLGWRKDHYKTFTSGSATIDPVTGVSSTADSVLAPRPTLNASTSKFSYGLVGHTPLLIRKRLPWDMDVSVTYNNSQNFRPTTQRYGILGNPISAESGITKEYGVLVSFFGGRFELRASKYESSAAYATNSNFRTALSQLNRIPEFVIEANSQGLNADKPAAIAAWKTFQDSPNAQRFYKNFGYVFLNNADGTVDISSDPRTDIVVGTSDLVSKGLELEAVFNPTRRWRIALNAARQEAVRSHTAPDLQAFFAEVNPIWRGSAASLRYQASSTDTLGNFTSSVFASIQKEYLLDGSKAPELRRWRWNGVTRYAFSDEGWLKGWAVGGSARWQDRIAIGYPVIVDPFVGPRYDVQRPYYGKAEMNYDAFVTYRRKIFRDRIGWSARLNVRNIGVQNKLIPISTEPDGSIAAYRIAEPVTWTLSNSFSF